MYQKMYTVLFNAITDSLEQMGELNFGAAQHILREAQKTAEELYMETESE